MDTNADKLSLIILIIAIILINQCVSTLEKNVFADKLRWVRVEEGSSRVEITAWKTFIVIILIIIFVIFIFIFVIIIFIFVIIIFIFVIIPITDLHGTNLI